GERSGWVQLRTVRDFFPSETPISDGSFVRVTPPATAGGAASLPRSAAVLSAWICSPVSPTIPLLFPQPPRRGIQRKPGVSGAAADERADVPLGQRHLGRRGRGLARGDRPAL